MIDKTRAGIDAILAQIRSYEARTRPADAGGAAPFTLPMPGAAGTPLAAEIPAPVGIAPGAGVAPAGKPESFTGLVKGAIDEVNALQQDARNLTAAYERGEDVPLTDVVLAMHKSSVAFEATLQIRNKIMKAYEDIKNMPV